MIIENDLLCPGDVLIDTKEASKILHISPNALARARWYESKTGKPSKFRTVFLAGRVYYSCNSIKSFIQNELND